jgi:PPOX class probable F420-dependent enzyme
MPSGSCSALSELPSPIARLLDDSRRAILATVTRDGVPHAVPVCFARRGSEIVSAIDDKPKGDTKLARVRNLEANPNATLLFDRWSEDWTELAWLMAAGTARIDPPHSADDVLVPRYAQYETAPPSGEVIVVTPARLTWWSFE